MNPNPVTSFFVNVRLVIAELVALYDAHGTKLLGTAATVVAAVLTVPDLIPPDDMRWWALANAVLGGLTIRRGFQNTVRQGGP